VSSLFARVLSGDLRLRSVVVQDETVHERVRRLRERKHLSQAELAAATGEVVTESWLQKFEKKHSPKYPTRDQLEPLAAPLGTSLGYLLAPMRIAPLEAAAQNDVLRAAEDELLGNTDIPEDLRELALLALRMARRAQQRGEELA
jgi:transcriptional regulator with XRE-family HTH domain